MKYRDFITAFVAIGFFCALGYNAAVEHPVWFWIFPVLLFVLLVLVIYKLWL